MKYTSSEAAKLLRQLNDELDSAYAKERKMRTFPASLGEDVDAVRPAYDFAATREKIAEIRRKILTVKHALNVFNLTTVLPGLDLTIDQALVLIPQLTREKNELNEMRNTLPKSRVMAAGYGKTSAVIDYCYANYQIEDAEAAYVRTYEKLDAIQTALDLLNSTCEIDIDV